MNQPDNVARADLDCPCAPQVVVVGKRIPRREDSPCRLTLETATTLRCIEKKKVYKYKMALHLAMSIE